MLPNSVKLAVDHVTVNKPQFEKAKANTRLVKYETEKLEQYTISDFTTLLMTLPVDISLMPSL